MKLARTWRFIREETVVGLLMIGLFFTTIDAAINHQGTPGFLVSTLGIGAVVVLCITFLLCGLVMLFIVTRRRVLHWTTYALLSLPLAFIIGSTILYAFLFNLNKSGVIIYCAFYAYMFIEILTRDEHR